MRALMEEEQKREEEQKQREEIARLRQEQVSRLMLRQRLPPRPRAVLSGTSCCAGPQGSAHQALQARGAEEERASSHRPPVAQLL